MKKDEQKIRKKMSYTEYLALVRRVTLLEKDVRKIKQKVFA